MSADAWITAATVVVMFAALASERVPPAASVLTATIFLLVVGVIDEAAALSGFANAAPWTVAALYVLAFAGDRTGLMGPLVNRLLGKGEQVTTASTARILLPTAGISAFINNTPLVAMLIGQVTSWCNRRGVSPSKLLLPISYAAILGGILTVIGTSTNLTASGLLQENGEAPIGLFEITKVSLIPAIAGLIVLIFIVPRLLPERKGALEEFTEDLNEFAAQMKVVAGGPLDGVTVADAGLRNLKGIYLVELERDGHMFPAVSPSRVLRGGDRLTFVGESSQVVDFQRVTKGLESAESEHLLEVDSPEHTFYEAVVGPDSRLVGQT
ncbi:MAG: SLC13 family permease, partial [Solirubrobacterales bacterium]